MLNEKLDFEIVHRNFRVEKGELVMRGAGSVLSLVEIQIKLKSFICPRDGVWEVLRVGRFFKRLKF